jgi:hypothetical protein
MRVPRTFESVVTELIAGLRSGAIALDTLPNETDLYTSRPPGSLSSNDRPSCPTRSEFGTRGEKASGS